VVCSASAAVLRAGAEALERIAIDSGAVLTNEDIATRQNSMLSGPFHGRAAPITQSSGITKTNAKESSNIVAKSRTHQNVKDVATSIRDTPGSAYCGQQTPDSPSDPGHRSSAQDTKGFERPKSTGRKNIIDKPLTSSLLSADFPNPTRSPLNGKKGGANDSNSNQRIINNNLSSTCGKPLKVNPTPPGRY